MIPSAVIFSFFLFSFGSIFAPKEMLIDKLVARVSLGEDPTLTFNIFYSDLHEPQIGNKNKTRTIDQTIRQAILFLEATRFGVVPSDKDVEKRLEEFKSEVGFSQKDGVAFEKWLISQGLSGVGALRNQIKQTWAIAKTDQVIFQARPYVSNEEIISYCKANPEYFEERYKISCSFVSDAFLTSEKKLLSGVVFDWVDVTAGPVSRSQLKPEMLPITLLNEGELSDPILTKDGAFVYRVDEQFPARAKTVDERAVEVRQQLEGEKRLTLHQELIDKLVQNSVVQYFNAG